MRGVTIGGLLVAALATTAPQALAQTTLYFPRLVTSAGATSAASEYTGFAVANLDATTATLTFTAYDRLGNLVTGTDVTNPATRNLASGRQLAVVDAQIFGAGLPARAPIGWVKVESTVTRTVGFFLTFNGPVTLLDGADVSSTTTRSCVLPEIEPEGTTEFHVVNAGATETVLGLTLVNPDGSNRVSVSRTVAPGGALVEAFSDLFPGATADPANHVRIVSTEPMVAYEHLTRKDAYVAGVNGQDSAGGATVLYAPQYVT